MRKFPKGELNREITCPVCNEKYPKNAMLLIESGSERETMHFTCEKCKISSLFFISENNIGMMGVGVLTDMSKNEVENFFQKEAISADGVLEVHKFLKNI